MAAASELGFLQGLDAGIALVVVISYSYCCADRVETTIASIQPFHLQLAGNYLFILYKVDS